ncbi:hypothetical protein ACFZDK_24750 [Streptomyces sp. NPDC007901]|uniref:hypothetical protein n=1 Tax=Streptomyces sp. NPDC007901 TaxID=3364785 RepID=UPI0036EEA7E3
MSRGHGRIERAILEAVAGAPPYDGLPISQLTAAVYDTQQPSRSQTVSLRRAVRRLEEQELVISRRDPAYPTPGRHYWRRTGRTIACGGDSCTYCAAGHQPYGELGQPVHVEYAQVRDVIEAWVRKHPAQWTDQEAAEAEKRRAEALQRIAAMERSFR